LSLTKTKKMNDYFLQKISKKSFTFIRKYFSQVAQFICVLQLGHKTELDDSIKFLTTERGWRGPCEWAAIFNRTADELGGSIPSQEWNSLEVWN
jgi:hypothetical protein